MRTLYQVHFHVRSRISSGFCGISRISLLEEGLLGLGVGLGARARGGARARVPGGARA